MWDAVAIHYLLLLEPLICFCSFFCVEVCHRNHLFHHVEMITKTVVLAKTRMGADCIEQAKIIVDVNWGEFNPLSAKHTKWSNTLKQFVLFYIERTYS